jgi:hypothetical protein
MRAKAIEREFRKAIALWRPIVGLSDWQVFVTVDNAADCVAQTVARPEYREVRFTLNADAAARDPHLYGTAPDIEYLALHELCHAPLWVLAEYAERQLPDHQARWHNENVTTKIARALWVARYKTSPPEGT